jgi:hypothetical protein
MHDSGGLNRQGAALFYPHIDICLQILRTAGAHVVHFKNVTPTDANIESATVRNDADFVRENISRLLPALIAKLSI